MQGGIGRIEFLNTAFYVLAEGVVRDDRGYLVNGLYTGTPIWPVPASVVIVGDFSDHCRILQP